MSPKDGMSDSTSLGMSLGSFDGSLLGSLLGSSVGMLSDGAGLELALLPAGGPSSGESSFPVVAISTTTPTATSAPIATSRVTSGLRGLLGGSGGGCQPPYVGGSLPPGGGPNPSAGGGVSTGGPGG